MVPVSVCQAVDNPTFLLFVYHFLSLSPFVLGTVGVFLLLLVFVVLQGTQFGSQLITCLINYVKFPLYGRIKWISVLLTSYSS